MSVVDAFSFAEIHRETYVGILKSWIPHGERGKFARQVGITREYFSYLCALDHPAEDKHTFTKRLPSPGLARKIAENLIAPLEVKQSFLENIELAHVNSARAYYQARKYIAQQRVHEVLSELEKYHRRATFGTELEEVRRAYRTVRDAAESLVFELSPEIYPASLAQACLYLHDAQCVLDRADDALRYAKLARLILENVDLFEPNFNNEQVENLQINAIRGEGVALHNLGLDRDAQNFYSLARTTSAYRNNSDFWKPLVGRDSLNAMARIPRFSIRSANKLALEIESICERKGDEVTGAHSPPPAARRR